MLTPLLLQQATESIQRHLPTVEAIYLFGSAATGIDHGASDVDMAFLCVLKPSGELMFNLKAELCSLFLRDVDLIDLRRSDSVTKAEVVATGVLLYAGSKSQIDFFETTVLSEYVNLNEERRGIIADVLKRGSVHG